MDRDLSSEQSYPPFEQLGPRLKTITSHDTVEKLLNLKELCHEIQPN